jgi:hypothetical protein
MLWTKEPFGPTDAAVLKRALAETVIGPTPRPWLPEAKDYELRRIVASTWRAVDLALDEAARLPDATFAKAFHAIRTTVNSRLGEIAPEANPDGGSILECAGRDIDRHFASRHGAERLCETVAGLSQRQRASFSTATRGWDRALSGAAGRLLDAWARVGGSESSFAEVRRRQLEIARRFGLDGLAISGEAQFSARQQLRWLDRAEKVLSKACKKIGISDEAFGVDRHLAFTLRPPGMGWGAGTLHSLSQGRGFIEMEMGGAEMVSTVVHEYAHYVDRRLGYKATGAEVFFTDLTPKERQALPRAAAAMDNIAKAASRPSLSDRVRNASASVASSSDQAGQVFEHGREKSINAILQAWPVRHLGASRFLLMPKQQQDAYRADLAAYGPLFLESLARHLPGHSMEAAIAQARSVVASSRASAGAEGPNFLEMGEQNAPDSSSRVVAALRSHERQLAQLVAQTHSLGNGPMTRASALADIRDCDVALGYAYYSRNTEIFARLWERPTFMSAFTAPLTPQITQAFGGRRASLFNEAAATLLSEAGVQAGATPQLRGRHEVVTMAAGGLLGVPGASPFRIAGMLSRLAPEKASKPTETRKLRI